jgi:phage tail sheath protein FI
MPEYLSPGVYVEEIPSGQAPIASVSTTIAGFIGHVLAEAEVDGEAKPIKMPPQPGKFQQGENKKNVLDDKGQPIPIPFDLAPVNKVRLITSWARFAENFGGFQPHNKTLAHAVYGFFNNGGNRCWVVRVEDATDVEAVKVGLTEFEKVDEITMVLVPGAQDRDIQIAVIDHCEKMQDRFAILDGQQKPEQLTVEAIKGGVRDSNYAALYFPWIKVPDPLKKGADELIAPSGHIAGLYARTDINRGVHKAPANDVLRGVSEVEWRLSKADQDGLNPKGVNVIRQFNGNVKVWGARTLGGDDNTEFKYINVRRLFLMLRESIDEGTQWIVFEPNAKPLWDKIRQNVTAFLTNVWRSGALFGDTPEQAFFVKCDEELNPKEVRDLGQVITEIGVAPVKPAEFVIFRIRQM